MDEDVEKQMYDALVAVNRDWHNQMLHAIRGTGPKFSIEDKLLRQVKTAITAYEERSNASSSEKG